MPDIGTTLREARMRQRIDISDVESATKIRAKYLRALENEEWDLLPGPTFVKSFLRTYADALGLDGKLLIEEYKLHHELLSDVDLQPIVPPGGRVGRVGTTSRDRRRGGRPAIRRVWAVAALVIALVVALYLLGKGSDDENPPRAGSATAIDTAAPASGGTSSQPATPSAGGDSTTQQRLARLEVVATGQVYVCLKAAGDRSLVRGVILTSGARQGPFRSSRFRLMLGNAEARLVVNGKRRSVPAVTNGIGYEITPTKMQRLPRSSWPSCPTP